MRPRVKQRMLVCGVMSGTSLDGIDSALVRISRNRGGIKLERVGFRHLRFPRGVKERLLAVSSGAGTTVDEITRLNVLMGELIADSARLVARKSGVPLRSVDLIGSHGQTICHLPAPHAIAGRKIRATLQIGEPSVIAVRTGIPTVGDFRPADMALGGQGAPLVPFFDWLVFRSRTKNRVLLNIGGIANITFLPAGCRTDDVVAFDTGPGNMVVDSLMQKLFKRPYDRGGRVALSGEIVGGVLDSAMRHRFFRMRPPKSAGREQFGAEFARLFVRRKGVGDRDLVATASFVTPLAVFEACQRYLPVGSVIDEVIVSGGGAKNRFFMKTLKGFFSSSKVTTSDEYGIPVGEKEALCFAVLAWAAVNGEKANLPSVTGAKGRVLLGKYCMP